MRKFRKYTATALVAMMVAGMTMSGYQPADVSASQESEYIIVTCLLYTSPSPRDTR